MTCTVHQYNTCLAIGFILLFVIYAAKTFYDTQAGFNYPSKCIRPQRVAARRQRELMVIIANGENGESVDWIDKEELDLNRISIPEDDDNQTFPVYSMSEHFASPWENEGW